MRAAATGRADEAGIAAELGVFDARLLGRDRKGHGANVGADIFKKGHARGDHAAAEENDVGVNRVHERYRADGEIVRCLTHQPARERIARVPGFRDRLARDVVAIELAKSARRIIAGERFVSALHQRGGRGIAFEMTVLAARAKPAVFHLDDHMTALGAVAVLALNDMTVDDDPAADSGSEREHDLATVPLARADPEFAVRCGIGIVLKRDRLLERVGQCLADRKMCPAGQIRRVEEHTGVQIHRSGRAEPDRGDPVPVQSGLADGLVRRFGKTMETRPGALLGMGFDAHRRHGPAFVVDHPTLDVRPAEVDSDVKRRRIAD